ncbi:hypothetical protein PTNB85_08945 [Pyrenophora teres f. teres]|uniref:Membrane protein n=1 Tax=Pyrenophora teres f. teres TaxID=97479 RepID=A0A6S6VHE6_9PLEO|nr:hypothetical protein HRS9139_10212 [Pyrenophora teres f. teres]KAE8826000.1 hypothetical protein PTNB85_08945 [Pyrenophora teres f. teres]KAE8852941.1 hypothetical protein PTNB29_10331 [Pyrenophora teres f. teres]CAE7000520.1 membrane protein [Pyrenophora teres f. teres]
MSDSTSSRAPPPLDLSPTALHAHARYEPHPDSAEAVRIERQRDTLRRRSSGVDGRASAQPDSATRAEEEEDGENTERKRRWYDGIVKFWTMQISLTIEEGAHRDHLALERTFLAYLRTSLLLAMMGIVVAQLFHLQHSPTPNAHFGFHKIGIPLAVACICMAIVVVLVGAVRFWRLQTKLTQGKALAGGVEVLLILGLVGMLLVGTFGLVLGIDIDKMYTQQVHPELSFPRY